MPFELSLIFAIIMIMAAGTPTEEEECDECLHRNGMESQLFIAKGHVFNHSRCQLVPQELLGPSCGSVYVNVLRM